MRNKAAERFGWIGVVAGLFGLAGLLSGCGTADIGETGEEGLGSDLGKIQARLEGNPEGLDDVAGILFEVHELDGTLVASEFVPLEEEYLPSHLDEGQGAAHRFADGLFTVEPGDYHVVAIPMRSESEPSEVCERAEKDVAVLPGVVHELTLVMQCKGEDNGGIDAIGELNHEPKIVRLDVEPSKFVVQCEEARIAVTAEDPDKDQVTCGFEVVEAPEQAEYRLKPEGCEATFESRTAGDYLLRATARDGHGLEASLKFPVHVSADDSDGDGVGDRCCVAGKACDDTNACTGDDVCVDDWRCEGTPLSCDDGNVCTDDSCDPSEGCRHTFNSIPCDDALACTRDDVCIQGRCVGTPGTEVCNGQDDDCDGLTDEEGAEGCTIFYRDEDCDGWGVQDDAKCLCGPAAPYSATKFGDCNDNDHSVNPAANEYCNGRDDNCDGIVDPPGSSECTSFHRDSDGDGFGLAADSKCLCAPAAPYTATKTGDCNDNDPSIHPGAPEVCNGKDDNCDGQTDPEGAVGCKAYYYDYDHDGWGQAANSKCLCAPAAPYTGTKTGDCDDSDKNYAEFFEITVPDKIVQKYFLCDHGHLIPRPPDFAPVTWTNDHAGFDIVFNAPRAGNVRVFAYGELDGAEQPDESLKLVFNGGASLVWTDNIGGAPGWYWMSVPGSVSINAGSNKVFFTHPAVCQDGAHGSVHFEGQGRLRLCYHN